MNHPCWAINRWLHNIQHTHTPSFGAIHLTFLHLFFSLDSIVEQGKASKESLSPRRILELLGMNTIQFSSMSKFLLSRVSIRGTLNEACNETIHTQAENLNSTLCSYIRAAIDGCNLEDGSSVERTTQGSGTDYRRIRKEARANQEASSARTLSAV